MQTEQLIITFFAADRPGIVQALSNAILAHNGSWLESSLSRLCGQFAGIVHIGVSAESKQALLSELQKLSDDGINVTVQTADIVREDSHHAEPLEIVVEANDRSGIVDEIATALAAAQINVEQMETECESASMAGYELFRAYIAVSLPEGGSVDQLETILEGVSDDLMVTIVTDD